MDNGISTGRIKDVFEGRLLEGRSWSSGIRAECRLAVRAGIQTLLCAVLPWDTTEVQVAEAVAGSFCIARTPTGEWNNLTSAGGMRTAHPLLLVANAACIHRH